MKKISVTLLIGTLILSTQLGGCTSSKAPEAPQTSQEAELQMPPPDMNQGQAPAPTPIDTNAVVENINTSINTMFPGDWSVDETTLKKGDYAENENYGIVDTVEALYPGSFVSIFVGETRVSSSVKNAQTNTRVLEGHPTPPEVGQAIEKGEVISGSAGSMGGSSYNKIYIPLKNGDKTVAVLTISLQG